MDRLATSAGYDLSTGTVSKAAGIYTSSSAFPGQFGAANGYAHDWLFTDTMAHSDSSGRWTIDLSPMLSDRSFKATLAAFGVRVPSKIEVPITDSAQSLRPGQFRAARKTLLLDLAQLGLRSVDNLEGMSWGAPLADGRRVLLLVSDDNFNPAQVTQLIALAACAP